MNIILAFRSCENCIHYDTWTSYDYGGWVNECDKHKYFCFPPYAAKTCEDYEHNRNGNIGQDREVVL